MLGSLPRSGFVQWRLSDARVYRFSPLRPLRSPARALARLTSLMPPLGAGAVPLLFPDFLRTPGSTNSRFSIQPSWCARFLLQPINSRIPITPASANIAAAVSRNVLGVQCPTPAFAQPRSMVFLMNFRVTGLSCLAPAGVNNTYLLLRPLSTRARHSSTR